MRTSVIVPVYNEEATLGRVLDRLLALDCVDEVVVVDDGSWDGTAEVIRSYGSAITAARLPVNAGKGSAVRHGLEIALGDVITIQDADLELRPEVINLLVEPIVEGRADVVYGSRFMRPGRTTRWAVRTANGVFTALGNRRFGLRLTDIMTAHKAFRASLLRGISLQARGFEIEIELTAQLSSTGARFLEVPSPYSPRGVAEGKKIRWRDGLAVLRRLVFYRAAGDPMSAPCRGSGTVAAERR